MNTKRIFIGSFTEANHLKSNFENIKNNFDKVSKIKWTRTPDNFHMTYYFLGETKINDIVKIQDFIQNEFPDKMNVELKIKGLSYFKRKSKPSVLFAKIEENNPVLENIYLKIRQFLIENNIIDEKLKSRFHPHITLGRIKNVEKSFYQKIEEYEKTFFDDIQTIKIDIIESILSAEGALYKKLKI